MWVEKKMVPKCELLESIPLHAQKLNCEINVRELEDHVEEEGLSSNWAPKLGLTKKTFHASFPNGMLENVWVKLAFLYALLPHHKRAK